MSPEWLPIVESKLFELGALDVYRTAIVMKKGRLGTCLSVLTTDSDRAEVEACLLTMTTALGVRSYRIEKTELDRDFITVKLAGELEGHSIVVKRGFYNGKVIKQKPEWDQIQAICSNTGLSPAEVTRLVMLQMEV